MNYDVDIRVVTTIATVLVVVATFIITASRHNSNDRGERRCLTYLLISSLSFGTAAAVLLFGETLPYPITVGGVVAGAHFGLVFAHLFVRNLFGFHASDYLIIVFAATMCLAQFGLATISDSVVTIVVTSSIVNGALGVWMTAHNSRAARSLGRSIAMLVSLPFLVISIVYLSRLPVVFLWNDANALTIITAALSLVMGISSIQWAFAFLAVKAFRLNQLIEHARADAEQLAAHRKSFLFYISHEIRTPLNAIVGTLDLARCETSIDCLRSMINDMIASGAHLTATLNQVLDYGRIEAHGIVLETVPFEVENLARTIEKTYRPICSRKGLNLDISTFPTVSGCWRGDPHKLSQILFNLVGNAVKFTEEGGVEISFSTNSDDALKIKVSDSGIGMRQDQLQQVFKEFLQADSSTLRRFGGSGLGMSISKKLVEAMNGVISVESEVGVGTTFRVEVPIPRAPDPSRPAVSGSRLLQDFEKRPTVLIADDSAANRRIMKGMLDKLNCDTTVVSDGQSAIEIALTQEFDLYIFDISMPKVSGCVALSEIRRRRAIDHEATTPAVAATGNMTDQTGKSYIEKGFDFHLLKPIRFEDLSEIVSRVDRPTAVAANMKPSIE